MPQQAWCPHEEAARFESEALQLPGDVFRTIAAITSAMCDLHDARAVINAARSAPHEDVQDVLNILHDMASDVLGQAQRAAA